MTAVSQIRDQFPIQIFQFNLPVKGLKNLYAGTCYEKTINNWKGKNREYLSSKDNLYQYDIVTDLNSTDMIDYWCDTCSQADIFAETFQSTSLMKIRRADTLSDNVPIRSTRTQIHLVLVHNFLQLLSYFSHLPHGFCMHVMLITPISRIFILFPLVVHVKEGQMIAFRHLEFFTLGITFLFSTLKTQTLKRQGNIAR